MGLFLGIDGGGSGCRAAVADASGRILGTGQGGPANIASDPPAARANIMTATRAALAQAVGQGRVAQELPRLVAGLGLAGANVPACAAALRAGLPFARVRLESDAVTALKGALQGGDGVVAAIGTGSVFAAQRGGVLRQIGGKGLALGDEGGGAWLGRALLVRALRAVDGFLAMTPLMQALVDELGGADGVVAFGVTAKPADFAAFAPRIAASGDPAAVAVMAAGCAEVAAAIDLLRGGDDLPVVFLGGLGAAYGARFAGRWPIRPALGSGLDGALWLARQAGQA